MSALISAVVEGDTDAALIRRLGTEWGLPIATVHVKGGKHNIRSRISGYNAAARLSPFVVLVDLDTEHDCAPELIQEWLPEREPRLCFRVAVRAMEAWLLADRERVARFLRVPRARIPSDPETLRDPKRSLVDIARASSSRDIHEDLVPRPGSGRAVGQAYSSRLIDFIRDDWRPSIAAAESDSLARASAALKKLADEYA
jgi:hypothetical protein